MGITRFWCSLDFSHSAKFLREGEMVLWPVLIHTGPQTFSPGVYMAVTLLVPLEF